MLIHKKTMIKNAVQSLFNASIIKVHVWRTILSTYERGQLTTLLINTFYHCFLYSIITGTFVSANGGAVWPALVTGLLGDQNLSNSMGALNFVCAMGNLAGPPIAGR